MKLAAAKQLVADRLGTSVADLADPLVMHEVRGELRLGRVFESETTYPTTRARRRPSATSRCCWGCRSAAPAIEGWGPATTRPPHRRSGAHTGGRPSVVETGAAGVRSAASSRRGVMSIAIIGTSTSLGRCWRSSSPRAGRPHRRALRSRRACMGAAGMLDGAARGALGVQLFLDQEAAQTALRWAATCSNRRSVISLVLGCFYLYVRRHQGSPSCNDAAETHSRRSLAGWGRSCGSATNSRTARGVQAADRPRRRRRQGHPRVQKSATLYLLDEEEDV